MDRRDFFCSVVAAAGVAMGASTVASRAVWGITERTPSPRPPEASVPVAPTNAVLSTLSTGFEDLDRITGGLRRGSITAIAGRPSLGSSTLALNIATHLALDCGVPAIYLSAPRGHCAVAAAVWSSRADVDRNVYRRDLSRFDRLQQLYARTAGLLIDDTPLLTLADIRMSAATLRENARNPPGVLMVDQPELLDVAADGAAGRERMAAAIHVLQVLAQDLDLAVVVVATLGRAVERRRDKRPRITDLPVDAIPIARVADVMLLLYRDEVYHPNSPDSGTAEIEVARNRYGIPGIVRLAFRPEFARFENYDWESGPG